MDNHYELSEIFIVQLVVTTTETFLKTAVIHVINISDLNEKEIKYYCIPIKNIMYSIVH